MNNSDFYSDDNDEELFTYGEDSAADPVFRSIKVESGFHTEHFTAFQQSAHFNAPQSIQFYKAGVNSKSSSETSTGCCPSVPFGVPNTKFNIIKSNYTLVMQSVSENLRNHDNFDFALCEDEFMWRGKYLKGSSCFELEINLYHDKGSDKHTVAVRKVVSDCSINGTFDAFFTAMKAALCNDPECLKPAAPARKRFVIPTNCSLMTVTDDDFLNGVQSIFRMCECSSLETRVQGAKMLCDLSLKSAHFLELPAFAPRCAALLKTLVHDEVDDVRQYAVMAVAAFAELDSYREAFLRSDVLPALFQLVENCQYETAQMRRTAAAVLALLCRTHPYSVRNELRQHDHCVDLNAWLQRAPLLQDARTRESALVVKACLEEGGVPAAADCDCDQHLHGSLMSEEEATLFALSH